MGADLISFYFRYTEVNPSANWKSKAAKVAEFVENVYDGSSLEDSYASIEDLSPEDCVKDRIDYDIAFNESYCSCDCTEFYGDVDEVMENIENGMKEYFPEYMWELHRYIEYGNVIEMISGYDGSCLYGGAYEVICCDEEDSEEIDFTVPEATEENPYPCPEYVRGDYDEFDRYWLNSVFS